ncbi:MAG: hypothetical protein ACJAYD_000895, partial [Patiriisocius sp.]
MINTSVNMVGKKENILVSGTHGYMVVVLKNK